MGCRRVGRLKEMRKVMKMVMLMKAIIAAMVPPAALRCHRERGGERVFPLCFLLRGLPLDGERFSLWSLGSMVMMAPSGFLLHGLRR